MEPSNDFFKLSLDGNREAEPSSNSKNFDIILDPREA